VLRLCWCDYGGRRKTIFHILIAATIRHTLADMFN
jgi:hypothetical protein